jgi:hypothetical protein
LCIVETVNETILLNDANYSGVIAMLGDTNYRIYGSTIETINDTIRPYKPRFHVAAGVAHKRTLIVKSHKY